MWTSLWEAYIQQWADAQKADACKTHNDFYIRTYMFVKYIHVLELDIFKYVLGGRKSQIFGRIRAKTPIFYVHVLHFLV